MKSDMTHLAAPSAAPRNSRECGNIFFALFGAVALLGILGASVTTFIRGPLSSSVKLTRVNVAESQMSTMAQVLVMQSASVANCDADNYVEPMPFVPAVDPPNTALTGGGLLPSNLSVVTTNDPWGTQYGYCVWDHGASQCGGGGRLTGAATQVLGQTVVAVVSAGPDKQFSTTCRSYAAADVNSNGTLTDVGVDLPMIGKTDGTDDIIFAYSYEEASGASGGLWSLKSSDANVAVIDKALEVDGNALFTGAGTFSSLSSNTVSARTNDFVEFFNGIKVPEAATIDPTCNGAAEGIVRRNGSSSLEMCVSNVWEELTAEVVTQIVDDTTTTCDGDTAGAVRYNSGTTRPEFCNGTAWQAFVTETTGAQITVTPDIATNLNVTGPCTSSCPTQNGTPVTFTITNTGTATTPAHISSNLIGDIYGSFSVNWSGSTCGSPLAPGASCTYSIYAIAQGNYSYTGRLELYYGGVTLVATVPLAGTGTGFGCTTGIPIGGGLAATCANATTPAYVVNFPGCDVPGIGYDLNEGYCDGDDSHDPVLQNDDEYWGPDNTNTTSGAQNIVNLRGYGNGRLPQASAFCDNLVQGGYSDWFLPSANEWQTYIYPSRALLGVSGNYWTSTFESNSWGGSRNYYFDVGGNAVNPEHTFTAYKVRCMRRHGVAFPSLVADTTPVLHFEGNYYYGNEFVGPGNIGHVWTTTSGERQRSENYVLGGVNTGVTVSVAGSGNPTFTVNNGSPVTTTTVYNTDTINIYADAPTSAGTSHTVTLTVSGVAFTWELYYAGSNTRQIFVTNAVWNANLGGITGGSGADSKCQTAATSAGLTGTWYAFLGTVATPAPLRVPWNWDRLENMRGEVVATNMGDLLDKTILSPVRYNESGGFVNNRIVWTGQNTGDSQSEQAEDAWGNCNTWSSSSSVQYYGHAGRNDALDVRWVDSEGGRACNLTGSIYCIGPF